MGKKSVKIVARIFGLFIALFLNYTELGAVEKNRSYLRYVTEITDVFAKEMEQEYDLECVGSGGSMPNDVQELEVYFVAKRKGNIQEARIIEVNGVNKLLNKINSHEKIKQFLAVYPFSPERVNVSVSFQDDYGDYYYDGTVAYVSFINGSIFYRSAEIRTEMTPPMSDCRDFNNIITYPPEEIVVEALVPLHKETYEEAVKIVKEEMDGK